MGEYENLEREKTLLWVELKNDLDFFPFLAIFIYINYGLLKENGILIVPKSDLAIGIWMLFFGVLDLIRNNLENKILVFILYAIVF